MSYLLDALKQSEHHDEASAYDQSAQQLKQQQELKRYRLIAISLGMIVALVITLMAGFAIGKWLQTKKVLPQNTLAELPAEPNDKSGQTELEPAPAEMTNKPVDEAAKPPTLNTVPAQFNQPMQQAIANQGQQYQWVQVPVNSAPRYPQGQPVLIQTPNGYQQVYNAPAQQYQAQQYQTQVNQAQQYPQPVPANNSSSNVDLSQYKVLGKPIDQPNTVRKSSSVSNEELETVPSELKNAFARAIKDTEQTQAHQVTQGTKNSSYAQPVELLPDNLLAVLPNIKYQAHIYSSSPDKRWIKLNNRELYEGDNIGDIEVLEITPEQSLLSFDGYEFSLKALQDWPE